MYICTNIGGGLMLVHVTLIDIMNAIAVDLQKKKLAGALKQKSRMDLYKFK